MQVGQTAFIRLIPPVLTIVRLMTACSSEYVQCNPVDNDSLLTDGKRDVATCDFDLNIDRYFFYRKLFKCKNFWVSARCIVVKTDLYTSLLLFHFVGEYVL